MINNDEQLAVVLKQLALAESALEDLRAEVYPKNPRNFEVLSEGYVDIINDLRALIDAYRARSKPAEIAGPPISTMPETTSVKG